MGLEKFGLEPLTLKIVSAQPPVSVRPQTLSKAPSVQIEIIGEDRVFYQVALHNLSRQAVTALSVDMPRKDGAGGGGKFSTGSRDLIAPGATYEFPFGIPHSGKMVNGSFVEDPLPPTLVLETVLFRDGSYEGDVPAASRLAAHRIGLEIQDQRINHLIEGILADTMSGDEAKVARIRSEVAQLTEDPDSRMVETLQSQFPNLRDQDLQTAKGLLHAGLHDGKGSVTFGLKEFERTKANVRGLTLAKWWSTWRQP